MYIISMLVVFSNFFSTYTTPQNKRLQNSLFVPDKNYIFYDLFDTDDFQDVNFDIYEMSMIEKRSTIIYCLLDEQIATMKMTCGGYINQYALVHRTGCKWYMMCDRQTSILKHCPNGTYFNGRICTEDFKCPTTCQPTILGNNRQNQDHAIKMVKSGTFKRWPVDNTSCRNYAEIQVDSTWKVQTVIKTCPINSWFDPQEKICKMAYLCQSLPNTARKCEGKNAKKQSICDPQFILPECERGKTAVVAVPRTGCHYYLICDVHQPRLRKCPSGKLFDEKLRNCSFDYECPHPCDLYDDVTQENPVELPHCIEFNSIGPVKNSYCSQYFNCSTYSQPTIVNCPTNLFYDPVSQVCTPGFKCLEFDCVPTDIGG